MQTLSLGYWRIQINNLGWFDTFNIFHKDYLISFVLIHWRVHLVWICWENKFAVWFLRCVQWPIIMRHSILFGEVWTAVQGIGVDFRVWTEFLIVLRDASICGKKKLFRLCILAFGCICKVNSIPWLFHFSEIFFSTKTSSHFWNFRSSLPS